MKLIQQEMFLCQFENLIYIEILIYFTALHRFYLKVNRAAIYFEINILAVFAFT